MPYILYR